MSYILDALNKSDQEKQRRRVTPGLDARHAHETTKRSTWPWALGFALLLGMNGAALYWWFGQEQSQAEPATATGDSRPPVPQAAPVTASAVQAQAQAQAQAVSDIRPAPLSAAQAETPASEQPLLITPGDFTATSSPPATGTPTSISALPESVQRALPELVFSSHIFASDADLRMVNINGRSLREGDRVADGLRLVEITEDGVVLDFRNSQFEVSVLRDWFPPN